MDRPAIKLKTGKHPFLADPLVGVSQMLGKAAQRIPYSSNDLRSTVRNRLNLHHPAAEREASRFRIWNRITREDPHYIEFSGMHLAQLLHGGGYRAPDAVLAEQLYLVRRDVVETCYAALIVEDDSP